MKPPSAIVAAMFTLPQRFGFFHGFLTPASGDHVVGAAIGGEEIHRQHRKLQTRAALQKQNAVVVGNA